MIDLKRTIIIICICALITLLERALPFLIFGNREVPSYINYLGKTLGLAIMVTLVVYCLRNISFTQASSFAPQLIACVITVILHLWKENAMISILGGTVACMLLTQLVFV